MRAKGVQPAAIPTRHLAAAGSGPLFIAMLKIMKTNNSINQFVSGDAVCLLFSLHSADKDTKPRGSLSLSTYQAHATLLYFHQQPSRFDGLKNKTMRIDCQIFSCIKFNS